MITSTRQLQAAGRGPWQPRFVHSALALLLAGHPQHFDARNLVLRNRHYNHKVKPVSFSGGQ
jgi:hypothetical protein